MARRKRRKKLKPSSTRPAGHGVISPTVAIVGRPNVGKSAIFNRMVGKMVSIVEPTAGVTRDRISALVEIDEGRSIELVDTGGLGGTDDTLTKDVDRQIEIALRYAEYVLFVCDSRAGLTALDRQIARRIARLNRPVFLVINKCETEKLEQAALEFWELGLGEPITVSANNGFGLTELLDIMAGVIPAELVDDEDADVEREMRVAVVGRRNVGKSTYLNALFGEERVIVSDLPGTTRDSIDVHIQMDDIGFTLIDTAGLRRRGRVDDAIEFYAHARAREAVARSDVTLLFLEASQKISLVDKHLARLIGEENKACVIVATKWDKVGERMTLEDFSDYVRKYLPSLHYCPLVLLSSQDEINVEGPIRAAAELYAMGRRRATTAKVNQAVRAAYEIKRPRVKRGILPRIYFATQIRGNPVSIVMFVNKPSLFDASYKRFLANQMRRRLDVPEVPIKLLIRERVNIFESGLHKRIRKLRAIGDERYIDRGKEEEPVDSRENIEDVFSALFGEVPERDERELASAHEDAPVKGPRAEDESDGITDRGEVLDDVLALAESEPEIFTTPDERLPEGHRDEGEHIFDEARDGDAVEDDKDAPDHPLDRAHSDS